MAVRVLSCRERVDAKEWTLCKNAAIVLGRLAGENTARRFIRDLASEESRDLAITSPGCRVYAHASRTVGSHGKVEKRNSARINLLARGDGGGCFANFARQRESRTAHAGILMRGFLD